MVGLARDEYLGYRHPFLNGNLYVGGVGDDPRTVTDLAMSRFSAFIRREEDWWKYIHDPVVRARWAAEGCGHTWTISAPSSEIEVWLSDSQEGETSGSYVEYVLGELSGYAQLRDIFSQVSCYDRIWESDSILTGSAAATFRSDIAALSDTLPIPEEEYELTRSILDPSLYCLIYGRTLAYDPSNPHSLRPEPLPRAYYPENTSAVCKHRAYLPTDFAVSPSGTAKAISYINNLHPRHQTLYRRFEEILSKCIPLFEHVLTDLHRKNVSEPRIKCPKSWAFYEEPEPPEFGMDDIEWATFEAKKRRWIMSRPVVVPDVSPSGYLGGLEARRHIVRLRDRNLQVIFHVFETRLHPGGQPYAERSLWHVQGMKNERIAACTYYYASVDNITGSALEFRTAVKSPQPFVPDDREAMLQLWGLAEHDPCHQHLGSVPIRENLCVAFPNIYQHRHSGFSLSDPSRPGHQRVVGIFLVDPDIQPIPSTARVPPQQKSWVRRGIEESKLFAVELIDKIMDETEGLMDEREAELVRKDMLVERDQLQTKNNQQYFGVGLV
ncbi:hypothetical protein BDN67DRAFT_1059389 [Paxillus ammoniavirescens]|nr:hypothetical protein BDN67DRAFT_1059389 [Paxillus ammoniavirescens]